MVSPTHVGMNRPGGDPGATRRRVPHACRDKPCCGTSDRSQTFDHWPIYRAPVAAFPHTIKGHLEDL
jgi:hypothetical protein